MKEIEHNCIILSCCLNDEGDIKHGKIKIKRVGFFHYWSILQIEVLVKSPLKIEPV
jgi:hypothetical protein